MIGVEDWATIRNLKTRNPALARNHEPRFAIRIEGTLERILVSSVSPEALVPMLVTVLLGVTLGIVFEIDALLAFFRPISAAMPLLSAPARGPVDAALSKWRTPR